MHAPLSHEICCKCTLLQQNPNTTSHFFHLYFTMTLQGKYCYSFHKETLGMTILLVKYRAVLISQAS